LKVIPSMMKKRFELHKGRKRRKLFFAMEVMDKARQKGFWLHAGTGGDGGESRPRYKTVCKVEGHLKRKKGSSDHRKDAHLFPSHGGVFP